MTERLFVFVTSPWVPVEWIEAHGLEPRGAWSAMTEGPVAVPEGVCAFAQKTASLAKAHPQDAVVFTTACDQMRRAADAAATGHSRTFLFNLPSTWQSSTPRRLYQAELARLGRFLETLGGRAPTDAQLERAIHDRAARCAVLRQFLQQRSGRPAAEALAAFHHSGSLPARPPTHAMAQGDPVPLALLGGPLLPSQWSLFDAIASAGGAVVLNATEPGERSLLPPWPELLPGQDRLAKLADHYFDHMTDVFHRPNSRLYAWLQTRLSARRSRGIVLWIHVGCDLWRAEAASLRDAFGLPVLTLEAHEGPATSLRNVTRLAAFLESLR